MSNDLDAIERYCQGEITLERLSAKQQEIFDRLDYADNLLRSAIVRTEGAVARQMVAKYKPHYPTYNIRTAYRDIDNAKTIHKSISRLDKDYERIRLISQCDWSLQKAQADGNLREFNAALSIKMKLTGADKIDGDAIPWDKLVSPAFYMQFNVAGQNTPMLDINEVMKLKGTLKNQILESVEDAEVINDISSFLDAEKQ